MRVYIVNNAFIKYTYADTAKAARTQLEQEAECSVHLKLVRH